MLSIFIVLLLISTACVLCSIFSRRYKKDGKSLAMSMIVFALFYAATMYTGIMVSNAECAVKNTRTVGDRVFLKGAEKPFIVSKVSCGKFIALTESGTVVELTEEVLEQAK